ncbi:hypothetical protein [Ruegeria sp. R14_0]|uniref:phage head spike fiber domain-containing protein n=1 Tax=Ruegeria sp. R14_0 TaxID=2821100 RepID=UPI001ADBD69F|nr:hypothetical protein [Ruegeria sp. R14_0]MBO9446646.1 hypothetical protein [Ruegeria sp. R14_0]
MTGAGQPVANAVDKSGHGYHAVETVSGANTPTLARHPASGLRQNLNGTSDLSGFAFGGSGSGANTIEANATIAPDGTWTAARLTFSAENQIFSQPLDLPSGTYVGSMWVKGVSGETLRCRLSGGGEFTHMFNGDWQQISGAVSGDVLTSYNISTWAGATARVVDVWRPQHEAGTIVTPYQQRDNQYDIIEAGQRDLWYFSFDQIAGGLGVTLPDLGSDVTEFWANEAGITIIRGQTIGAGHRELPGSTRLYAYGIIDRGLSEPETASLTKFLEVKSKASA